MDSGIIQEFVHLSIDGEDSDEVILVQSGFEQLSKRKVLWKIENFVCGADARQFGGETFQIEIEKNVNHRGSLCIFNLTTEKSKTVDDGYDAVFSYCNEVDRPQVVQRQQRNDNDDNSDSDDNIDNDDEDEEGENDNGSENANNDENVFHFVEVSILDFDGRSKWRTFKTDSLSFSDSDEYEIFRVNNESSPPLISGCLVIEAYFTILRKKPLVKAKVDMGLGLSQIIEKPKTDFRRFLNSKDDSDIKIYSSDGTEFHAHKIILRAESEVFEAMLKTEMTESKTGIIKLDDMSAAAVTFLLTYVYCGDILPFSVNGQKVEGVSRQDKSSEKKSASSEESLVIAVEDALYVASKYRLDEVLNFFDLSFRRLCSEENAMHLFELSKLYSLGCKEFLKKFILSHPGILSKILEP